MCADEPAPLWTPVSLAYVYVSNATVAGFGEKKKDKYTAIKQSNLLLIYCCFEMFLMMICDFVHENCIKAICRQNMKQNMK